MFVLLWRLKKACRKLHCTACTCVHDSCTLQSHDKEGHDQQQECNPNLEITCSACRPECTALRPIAKPWSRRLCQRLLLPNRSRPGNSDLTYDAAPTICYNLGHMVQPFGRWCQHRHSCRLQAAYQQASIFQLEADIIGIHTALLLDDYGIQQPFATYLQTH